MAGENKTLFPDNLKSGMENFSGYGMDDVKVHYNSSQPANLNKMIEDHEHSDSLIRSIQPQFKE